MPIEFSENPVPRKTAPKPDDPVQSKRFIEAAKKAEVDEDPKAFERAFKKVIKARSPPPTRE